MTGDEESFMAILRETNGLVKRFEGRLASLEDKVKTLRDKEKATASAQQKRKIAVGDDIRVRHSSSQ